MKKLILSSIILISIIMFYALTIVMLYIFDGIHGEGYIQYKNNKFKDSVHYYYAGLNILSFVHPAVDKYAYIGMRVMEVYMQRETSETNEVRVDFIKYILPNIKKPYDYIEIKVAAGNTPTMAKYVLYLYGEKFDRLYWHNDNYIME